MPPLLHGAVEILRAFGAIILSVPISQILGPEMTLSTVANRQHPDRSGNQTLCAFHLNMIARNGYRHMYVWDAVTTGKLGFLGYFAMVGTQNFRVIRQEGGTLVPILLLLKEPRS